MLAAIAIIGGVLAEGAAAAGGAAAVAEGAAAAAGAELAVGPAAVAAEAAAAGEVAVAPGVAAEVAVAPEVAGEAAIAPEAEVALGPGAAEVEGGEVAAGPEAAGEADWQVPPPEGPIDAAPPPGAAPGAAPPAYPPAGPASGGLRGMMQGLLPRAAAAGGNAHAGLLKGVGYLTAAGATAGTIGGVVEEGKKHYNNFRNLIKSVQTKDYRRIPASTLKTLRDVYHIRTNPESLHESLQLIGSLGDMVHVRPAMVTSALGVVAGTTSTDQFFSQARRLTGVNFPQSVVRAFDRARQHLPKPNVAHLRAADTVMQGISQFHQQQGNVGYASALGALWQQHSGKADSSPDTSPQGIWKNALSAGAKAVGAAEKSAIEKQGIWKNDLSAGAKAVVAAEKSAEKRAMERAAGKVAQITRGSAKKSKLEVADLAKSLDQVLPNPFQPFLNPGPVPTAQVVPPAQRQQQVQQVQHAAQQVAGQFQRFLTSHGLH